MREEFWDEAFLPADFEALCEDEELFEADWLLESLGCFDEPGDFEAFFELEFGDLLLADPVFAEFFCGV